MGLTCKCTWGTSQEEDSQNYSKKHLFPLVPTSKNNRNRKEINSWTMQVCFSSSHPSFLFLILKNQQENFQNRNKFLGLCRFIVSHLASYSSCPSFLFHQNTIITTTKNQYLLVVLLDYAVCCSSSFLKIKQKYPNITTRTT